MLISSILTNNKLALNVVIWHFLAFLRVRDSSYTKSIVLDRNSNHGYITRNLYTIRFTIPLYLCIDNYKENLKNFIKYVIRKNLLY